MRILSQSEKSRRDMMMSSSWGKNFPTVCGQVQVGIVVVEEIMFIDNLATSYSKRKEIDSCTNQAHSSYLQFYSLIQSSLGRLLNYVS